MKITNNPKLHYIEDGCYKYTFDAKKVKKFVEDHCRGDVLNLFAGKNRLNVTHIDNQGRLFNDELRVDLSLEFNPDFPMSAQKFLELAIENNLTFDTIIYDPPWNLRKNKEFYAGRYIGKFTKLKNNIVKLLREDGRIISIGYEISNFGKGRNLQVSKLATINSFGEIRPYFVSIETFVYVKQLMDYFTPLVIVS